MRVPFFTMLCAVALLALPAKAQTAVDFFHRAGQAYIASDLTQATATVNEGLQRYPSDEKLQALKRKIEEQQKQQGGESDQPSQPQPGQGGTPNDQGDEGPNPDPQQNQPSDEGEQQPQPGQDTPRQSEQGQDGDRQAQGEEPSRLSREDAEQILQALLDDEQRLLKEAKRMKTRPRAVEKDW